MKQYNLGPNGTIITALNLFATKVDQVIGILEKRTAPPPADAAASASNSPISRIIVDTPGQIECFVWSASGSILLDALASSFPTVIAYVVDTPRTASPATFMANMLYACSILYKTKLPMILVFNKTDAHDAAFAKEWMTDFEAFQAALRATEDNEDGAGGSGYMGSLLNSMSLMLEEFYNHLEMVGVSAMTGDGIDEFFKAVERKAEEFEKEYKPELEKMRQRREAGEIDSKKKQLEKMMRDMDVGQPSGRARPNEAEDLANEPGVLSDFESDDDEDGKGWVDTEDAVPPGGEDEDKEDGLKKRYEQVLRERAAEDETLGSNLHNYLRANN
jgi:GTPase SAR1 family protein